MSFFKGNIVQYGENGRNPQYGKNNYRGNTDGGIVVDFLDYIAVCNGEEGKTCSDYMSGSFTTRDVCMERGISGTWTDLSQGFNMLTDEIPDNPEAIFWHPPYSEVIGIPYAGAEWGAKKIWTKDEKGKNRCQIIDQTDSFIEKYGYDPKDYDLGRMPWDKFVKAMNYCMMKQYSALQTGGRIGILMGDMRRKGKYYSMFLELAKPGEIESVVIKKQSNTLSGYKTYSNNKFIPIEHETFLILKKPSPYVLDFSYLKKAALDIRDSISATWKDVVNAVMDKFHGLAVSLEQIYAEIEGHQKTLSNPNWKAKVRQTLQQLSNCINVEKGKWQKVAI